MLFALRENAQKDTLDIDVLDIIGRGFMFEGVTAKDVLQKLRDSRTKNVNVRINSVGGVVDEAMAIRALLKERAAHGSKVNVTVLGAAASAATIVADAGTDVAIGKGAYFMIHEASTSGNGRGTADDHERALQRLRIANDGLVDMYVAASAARGKNKSADEFRAAMKRESYFDAAESVEWGLADRVVEDVVKIAACADVSAMANAPAALREQYEATVASMNISIDAATANANSVAQPTNSAVHGGKKGKTAMNASEIKTQYPEAYAAIFRDGREEGVTAGRTEGQTSERKRVLAHLKLADASGAHTVARAAIESGKSAQDDEVFAEYQSAAMNRRDAAARQLDSDKAGVATDGAAPDPKATKPEPTSLLELFAADIPQKAQKAS